MPRTELHLERSASVIISNSANSEHGLRNQVCYTLGLAFILFKDDLHTLFGYRVYNRNILMSPCRLSPYHQHDLLPTWGMMLPYEPRFDDPLM